MSMQRTFLLSASAYFLALLTVKYTQPALLHEKVVAYVLTLIFLQVDTIFLLAATVYITQLLFHTWALTDQQAKKWPLLGYAMLPILLLQHGDTAW